jgi:hypothetical protein
VKVTQLGSLLCQVICSIPVACWQLELIFELAVQVRHLLDLPWEDWWELAGEVWLWLGLVWLHMLPLVFVVLEVGWSQ